MKVNARLVAVWSDGAKLSCKLENDLSIKPKSTVYIASCSVTIVSHSLVIEKTVFFLVRGIMTMTLCLNSLVPVNVMCLN